MNVLQSGTLSVSSPRSEQVVLAQVPTALGGFGVVLSSRGVCRVTFPHESFSACESWAHRYFPEAKRVRGSRLLDRLTDEMAAYFAGRLREFSTPLDLRGTPFQLRVWDAVRRIPYGESRSYASVARDIGSPTSVRAVGAANASNPVPILVPCHRVIGSNGKLVGFGGGLPLKERLLQAESTQFGF